MKQEDYPVSVESLLNGAKDYLSALEVLTEHPNKQLIYPMGLLAAQALELALKAFLLHKGWTEKQFSSKGTIGHNLVKAWEEAQSNGLKLNIEHKYSIQLLTLGHNDNYGYLFRYPREKVAPAITEPQLLCRDVRAVIVAVENCLRHDCFD